MIILGYPSRLAVNKKELKEVRTLTRSRIDYRSAPSGRTGLSIR